MGLDMYLFKYPRCGNLTLRQMDAAANYHIYTLRKSRSYSFNEWCGIDESELPPKTKLASLVNSASVDYHDWDHGKQFPISSLRKEVGYWRKANEVHQWFVNKVQGGEDDCLIHDEVTKEMILELRDICKEIIETAVMVDGKVQNGFSFTSSGGYNPLWEDGRVVLNPDVCERLLPTTDGFFFGGVGYDQWYMNDISYTYELCERLLNEIDFETEMLAYCSSW